MELPGSFRLIRVFMLALSIALVGCAGIVRSDNAGDKKYSDIKSAKLDTKAIGEVKYGDFKNMVLRHIHCEFSLA